jgi:selenocysteine-specific elongation factor
MRNIIAGTAGHIDHGKTALVRALTGVDTDRLAEEKRRGISIDLGFAHLDLEQNIRLGLVDVPGHERFIKNMLAGVGGIDFVLFIIAADESIKPQTREHFDICRLLRIPRGIIVLTKADLVDPDILALVRIEVDEFVRGSFLANAPVIAVSSVTGSGLDELKAAMASMAREVTAKDASRWFRMPVDRAFSMRGFGTVVTGTLISGSLAPEDEVEIHPGARRLRVRGVQVHGQPVGRAFAGQRTAVNLAGVEVAELERGMVLAPPGRFHTTTIVDTSFELLPGAHPLRHGAPVHFHAGTAEVEAQARLLHTPQSMPAGSRGYVRFRLREPLLLLPGDRFIVRMFSPVVTIGGGEVLDTDPPLRIRRATAADRSARLEQASAPERVALLAGESEHGMNMDSLISRTGLAAKEIEAAAVAAGLFTLREPQFWVASSRSIADRARSIQAALQEFHKQNPLAPGMLKEDLRARVLPGAPPFLLDAILAGLKTVAAQGELVRLASHKMALKEDEAAALAKIEAAFAAAGLAVPAVSEVLSRSGVEPARARPLLQILIRNRKLLKIGDDLVFHQSALDTLKRMLADRKGQRFSVPEFKDWTGISRKYAIPLLEFLDRDRVTRREGDVRIVL